MRRFKTKEEIEQEEQEERERRGVYDYRRTPYDYSRLIAVYGRQSTKEQTVKNKESAAQQAVDLMDYALEIGWPDDMRILFIENQLKDGTIRNASGRLRIDERPGLQELVEMIQRGEVSAVLVRAVDRLFRDEKLVQAATFANICQEHHVIIVTFRGIYDFNNPARDDLIRFVEEAERGGRYITEHVIGTMLGNRRRKAMRGEYTGHGVAAGLMLDDERKHFIPNPVWSPIVARLFKRYRELDGSLTGLLREIIGRPIFPDIPDEIKAHIGHIQLTKVEGGYTLVSHTALKFLLTNSAYIGHMAYEGRVTKYNAHPAIVDEGDFWYAYNRIAKTTLEGEPIAHERHAVRYTQKQTPRREVLLEGVRGDGRPAIESHQGNVYIFQQNVSSGKKTGAAYTIKNLRKRAVHQFGASIYARELDALVLERVRVRLQAMPRAYAPETPAHCECEEDEGRSDTETEEMVLRGRLRHAIEEARQQIQHSLVSVDTGITETRAHIKQIERRLDIAQDSMSDADLRDNYALLKSLRAQLANMESKKENAAKAEQELQAAHTDIEDIRRQWDAMPVERKRRVVKLMTHAVYLDEIASGWLRIIIEWGPVFGRTVADVGYLWRTSGKLWTEEEDTALAACYRTATRQELQERFPARSWHTLIWRASEKRFGARLRMKDDCNLPVNVSLEDIGLMRQYGLEQEAEGQRIWWKLEESMSDINNDGRSESLSAACCCN